MEPWTLVRFLHLGAMAFFVGGQLVLVAAVVPTLRGADPGPMRGVARRFGLGSLVAVGVLVATGVAMASHYGRWEDEVLRGKLALLVLIGVLIGLHVVTPQTRLISIGVFLLSLATVWLGLLLSHG